MTSPHPLPRGSRSPAFARRLSLEPSLNRARAGSWLGPCTSGEPLVLRFPAPEGPRGPHAAVLGSALCSPGSVQGSCPRRPGSAATESETRCGSPPGAKRRERASRQRLHAGVRPTRPGLAHPRLARELPARGPRRLLSPTSNPRHTGGPLPAPGLRPVRGLSRGAPGARLSWSWAERDGAQRRARGRGRGAQRGPRRLRGRGGSGIRPPGLPS